MKFRALISDIHAMRDFLNICTSLSKLSKECVMRIAPKKMYFIVSSDDIGPKRPFVWCELPVNFYFKEYNLVGLSDQHNEIFLLFNTGMLFKSLLSAKNNLKTLKIKLTNKNAPCLTFEIEQAMLEGGRQCVHDIPVEVIERKYWSDYQEPISNDYHVTIQMPSLKLVKNIVERMKAMSPELIVSASKGGRLTFQAKTNMVAYSAHFPDLNIKSFAVGHQPTMINDTDLEDSSEVVTTVVDVKKFLMFLNGMHVSNYVTTCSIVHENMLKLFLEQPGALALQCFLTQINH